MLQSLNFIATSLYPEIPKDQLSTMIEFNTLLHSQVVTKGLWGIQRGPWEFNLRDVFRWCDLLRNKQQRLLFHTTSSTPQPTLVDPKYFVDLVYLQKMRTVEEVVIALYQTVFREDPIFDLHPYYHITPQYLQVSLDEYNS